MNVLSLFDGISCGQVALHKALQEREREREIRYYSCEIKQSAIEVTQKNFPDTIQLGDVTKVDFTQFKGKIDLLIGGSPCQNLSVANKKREGLKGEKSCLFYEYVRALKEVEPKWFFLENVRMPKQDFEIISKELGTYPILINSKLVSAQLRNRFYWFNWGDKKYDLFGFPTCNIPQPEDKGITLQSILENGYTNRKKQVALMRKSYLIYPSDPVKREIYVRKRMKKFPSPIVYKSPDCNIDSWRFHTQTELERLQTLPDGYTDCLDLMTASDCIGDGWTVDVVTYIFKFLFDEIFDKK